MNNSNNINDSKIGNNNNFNSSLLNNNIKGKIPKGKKFFKNQIYNLILIF